MNSSYKNKQYLDPQWTIEKVGQEMATGLLLLNKIDQRVVAFFGSHKVKSGNKYYAHAEMAAYQLGKKGYAILTGGGPGIMHAANTGAMEAKAHSLGLKAELLKGENVTDPIFTENTSFHFLFVRRFIMSIKSDALIFYPGGYGTLNELFEYAVLMQTGIVDTVPIICVDRKYWQGLFEWLTNNPLKEDFFICEEDIKLIQVVDNVDEIIALIEKK